MQYTMIATTAKHSMDPQIIKHCAPHTQLINKRPPGVVVEKGTAALETESILDKRLPGIVDATEPLFYERC